MPDFVRIILLKLEIFRVFTCDFFEKFAEIVDVIYSHHMSNFRYCKSTIVKKFYGGV